MATELPAGVQGAVDTALASLDELPESTDRGRGRGRDFDAPAGWRRVGRYLLLALVSFVVLFPIYTTVIAAFKPSDAFFDHPLLPGPFTFDVIVDAWTAGNLGRYLFNSLVVATIVTVFQVVSAVLAAYAFAFLRFPGRNVFFVVFIATLLVPLEATLVVNFDTVDGLGWSNSYIGLAVPFLATAFGVFLMRQVFLTLPLDLRDAAAIDGVGHFGFLWYVAVPLVRPTLGALALFGFLGAWNQYLWPNLIINETEMNTVQSGLRVLSKSNLDQPNLVMAGTLVAAIPVVIVLLVFQRQLVRGLTAGAVKG
ncbi:MAG: carbohydrate ABC transporter permease [Ilumatobacteraceae bacterium]